MCGCNYLNIRRRRRASSGNISQLAPYYASNLRPAIRARCFWEVETDEYLRGEPTSSDSTVPSTPVRVTWSRSVRAEGIERAGVGMGRDVEGMKRAVVGQAWSGNHDESGGTTVVAVVPDIDVKVFHLGRTLFSRGSREINRIKSLPTGISLASLLALAAASDSPFQATQPTAIKA